MSSTDTPGAALNTALFTRFVRRRNFAGFPFLVSASPETCSVLAARALDYAASQGFGEGVRLADCSPATLGMYREQGFLPERPISFEGKRDFKMCFPVSNPNQQRTKFTEHALFGEVEHWTHVQVVAGLPDTNVINATIPPISPWAYSSVYGFLTSNPVYAGCGLQMEAGLHLPALAAGRKIHAVQKAVGAMGYDLQPLSLRTPGSAESGYFRLLSRGGMDFPEDKLYQGFVAKTISVLAAESRALEQWHKREPNRLEDHLHRALRLLQEARRMEYPELMSLASFVRIGVYLGFFPENLLNLTEKLRVESQPFHLQSGSLETTEEELNKARADLSRNMLAGA